MNPTQTDRTNSRQPFPRRRGIVSVLAMLFMVIFAAVALGFYAQTTVSAQLSSNERSAARALTAAESGMAFMRYQLSLVEAKYLEESQMLVELAVELDRVMGGSGNLDNGAQEVGMSADGTAILIPRDEGAVIALGNGTGFRCRITRSGRRFAVKVAGRSEGAGAGTGKGLEYTFEAKQLKAQLFDYGVAGRGQIELSGGGTIRGGSDPTYGSVLSVTATNPAVAMTGPSVISGKVTLGKPTATYSYGATSSVNGSTVAAVKAASTLYLPPKPPEFDHYDEWPQFPTIDTRIYLPFVRRTLVGPPGGTLRNIRIPANSGTVASPLKFLSGTVVEGVCYIESPNVVSFEGGCVIRGVVVTPNTAVGTVAANVIEMKGSATAHDMATLAGVYDMSVPANAAEFPPELLKLNGASVLAPGFHVNFSGGYASISGSICSDKLTFTGTSGGNITGYVIGMANQKLVVSGSGSIQLERPPPTPWPAGMFFRNYYAPLPKTYREFRPADEGV